MNEKYEYRYNIEQDKICFVDFCKMLYQQECLFQKIMTKSFFTSYVCDSYTGDKIFDNAIVNIDVTNERAVPVTLQQKLSLIVNKDYSNGGRYFPVTLINFWEIEL